MENTTPINSKTVFVKDNLNLPLPQVSTRLKKIKNDKCKHEKKPLTKPNHLCIFTYGEHGDYSAQCIKNREASDRKLMYLANQSKVLNNQVVNLFKLLERSSVSKHGHATSSHGSPARMPKASSTFKVKIDLLTSGEKRVSPSPIPRPNPSFMKEKQVWVTREDTKKLTISTKLEALSTSNKIMTPKK
ncbi:unnamed protein product [Ilex paraguariensis]|uniref:Uncharacterized protein n=1 Tax=Ilex paraguariensis TaxID=185542 RepID=A0ABC8URV0_9AQUA